MKKRLKQYLLNILAKSRRQEGFTLIIVILILLIVPNLLGQKQKADQKTTDAFRTTVETQMMLYENEYGDKPGLKELEKENYLTSDQVKKAISKGFFKDNVYQPK